MRNEVDILNSLVKTGAGCTKSIRKNGDEISVCRIETSGRYPYAPWASSSTEEIITYKGGLIQTQEIRRAKKDGDFIPVRKITHHYKPTDEPGYDIEETIITEFGESKPTRVETRFRGTGTGKRVTVNGTFHFGTFLGNEEELLSVTDLRLNEADFDKNCYDHVVFTTSVDENSVNNNVRVSTPSGNGEYVKNQMLIGSSSSFGVTAIKDTFEACKWTVRHPIYPDLPVAKFYGNHVTIYDYEWRPTKYGNGRITRIRAFANDMDTIVKYTAVADALKCEYKPAEAYYPETFPRTPYGENIDVKITEGEYAGSYFSFQIMPTAKNDTAVPLFYGGIKPEDNKDNTEGFLVIPLRQNIKLAMNGNVPNSKRSIELKTVEKIDPPKKAFIVRVSENVNDAIMHYISNYEIDATKYISASETYKYVQDDGTIIIQETEYVTPNVEEPDVALSGV